MVTKAKPYERFGSFVLFKLLDRDPLGEQWRAGVIEGDRLGAVVALRRFTGPGRAEIASAAAQAREVIGVVTGTTVVRSQRIDVGGQTPFLLHEYAGGRSLRYVMKKALEPGAPPLPIDQAIAIVEKVASSCETIGAIRYEGVPLIHGALIPHFVWISDEGEIRVAGQLLAPGIAASLASPEIDVEIGAFFAPEVRSGAAPSRASDVYSLGALLYLTVTGTAPAPAAGASELAAAVAGAKTLDRSPIPPDIGSLLRKALDPDPAKRYGSAAEMHTELAALLTAGAFAPTTFNLAFYLHTLLKKEIEVEAGELERESKVNAAAYAEEIASNRAAAVRASATAESFATAPPLAQFAQKENPKGRLAVGIGVGALLLVAAAAAAWFALRPGPLPAPVVVQQAAAIPTPAAPEAPLAETSAEETAEEQIEPAVPQIEGEEARRRAIEHEIDRRMQGEMMKLQAEFDRELRRQSRPATVAAPPPAAETAAAASAPSQQVPLTAEQLDALRRASRGETPAAPAQQQTSTQPPAPAAATQTALAPPATQTAPALAAAPSAVREGDLIPISDVDQPPRRLREILPIYPPIAARQNIEAVVFLSVLVSETGKVEDVRVLRGDGRKLGFDEAAIRAVRSTTFSPAIKEGQRVKTWAPIDVRFRKK
jgi:TonB family protein